MERRAGMGDEVRVDPQRSKGYQVRDFRMFNDTEGVVSVENPQDEVQVSVQSTRPPTALAVLIVTPCYRPGAPA
jgi:hypothetical protein